MRSLVVVRDEQARLPPAPRTGGAAPRRPGTGTTASLGPGGQRCNGSRPFAARRGSLPSAALRRGVGPIQPDPRHGGHPPASRGLVRLESFAPQGTVRGGTGFVVC